MKFRQWVGGVCALTAITLTVGCGGGGGSTGPTVPVFVPLTSLTATSGGQTVTAPVVSQPAVDQATGSTVVSLTDPSSGTALNNVVVPARADLQPTSGQPALVINAANLDFGANFKPAAHPAVQLPRALTPVSFVTLYEGDVADPAHALLKVGVGGDNKLQNSVALGAKSGTYTLGFTHVAPQTAPGTSLVFDSLEFVFQVRTVNGQPQTTLLNSLHAALPAFGQQITHDASKPDWTGGGIQFGLDSGANGGSAELFVSHANGTIDAKAVIGNAGASGSSVVTQILTQPGGPTMGSPCGKVRLTCLFAN